MSLLLSTAKTKLFIGAAALAYTGTDFVEADFNAVSFTEIKGTTNLGSAGDSAELITSNQINVARTRKMKGVRNAGNMQVVCDLDPTDAGQIALLAAEKTEDTYPIKVQFAGGAVRLFTALIMSASEQYDEANSVMKLNVGLEIDSNVVRVPAP